VRHHREKVASSLTPIWGASLVASRGTAEATEKKKKEMNSQPLRVLDDHS